MVKGKRYETKKADGMEQACVLLVVPCATGNFSYLCHAWGIEDGIRFFDTVEENRVLLSEGMPFMLHCPNVGKTYLLDGSTRDLQSDSVLVVN
jgi:hypothetical protein